MKASPLFILLDNPQYDRGAITRYGDHQAAIARDRRLRASEEAARQGNPKIIGRPAARGLRGLLACWGERVRERRRLRSFAMLDDALLRDIGFTRCELDHEVSKPFWR